MSGITNELRNIQGIKSIKNRGDTLKIKLYSREKGDVYEIEGDLRKISQKISHKLDEARSKSEIDGWNWVQKPEKQYRSKGPDIGNVNDRQPIGHKPPFYTVSIQK
jgi:UDP-glucose 4-epimerase